MEIYASKLKTGDKVNMYCDGWKIVKNIQFRASITDIMFEDGSTASFWNDTKLIVIRED